MQYAGYNYLKIILCPIFSKFFSLLYVKDIMFSIMKNIFSALLIQEEK